MYTINNIPISTWGLLSGVIGSKLTGYALEGAWSLPARLGTTHRDWQGEIEPYVAAQDINLGGRDLVLRLVCKALQANQRREMINAFMSYLPDNFTLSHPVLGAFYVGVKDTSVKYYLGQWAGLNLALREPNPIIGGSTTPDGRDNQLLGIDGYRFSDLGMVVAKIEDRQSLPQWQQLSVTVDPKCETWVAGYRSSRCVTITATIKGASYADFEAKIKALQSLFSAPGVRKIVYFDGSILNGFCVEGFTVSNVRNFKPTHWGNFTCKLILV